MTHVCASRNDDSGIKRELPQEGFELTLADAALADSSHEWRTDLEQLVLW